MNTTRSSHSTMIELSSRASWEITGLRQKYPRWIGLGIQVDWLSPISLCLTTSFDLGTLLTQKINTLESEGKCSPSSGKSTKRASQFDLKLTREKTKSNSRAYRLGF